MIDGVIRLAQFGPRADFLKPKMHPEPIYGKRHDFTEKTKREKMIW